MKDESAYLQPTDAAPTAPEEPPVAHLPLYRPGTLVVYQGQTCTVSHVVVSRGELLVSLRETGVTAPAEKVQLAPTRILLQRS
ncbi:MAG: hypothetical protein K2X75_12965 [Burkholderiaceae bacterium]|nr:hypothetical protein [Burkholderiaceae bacterium]